MLNLSALQKYMPSLEGKRVAITGSTGGLGTEICRFVARAGGIVLQLDRNPQKSEELRKNIRAEIPNAQFESIQMDLSSMADVYRVTHMLKANPPDYLIHNAGAYSIPRKSTDAGLDNVFQINFAAPYYMTRELAPYLKEQGSRVIAVGSIAHNYSKTDSTDVEFLRRNRASLVYGNAKRYLMYAMDTLCKEAGVSLSVTHPGVTPTGITAHYPKWIYALIRHPMKVIFMRPKKAVLSILWGLFIPTEGEWIGPRLFDVWGLPKKKPLKTAKKQEVLEIYQTAEEIYQQLKRKEEPCQ